MKSRKNVNSPARRIGERAEDQVFNGKVRRGVSPVDITLFVHGNGIENLGRTSYALAGQFLRRRNQLLLLVGRQINLPQTVVTINSNEVIALRVKGQSQWTSTARLLICFRCKREFCLAGNKESPLSTLNLQQGCPNLATCVTWFAVNLMISPPCMPV